VLKALCALGLRIHEKRLWRVSDPGVCQHPIEVSPLEPSTENLSHLRSKRIRPAEHPAPNTTHAPVSRPLCSGEYAMSTMSSSLMASSMPLRSGLLYVRLPRAHTHADSAAQHSQLHPRVHTAP